jgi:hypothetical protein
MLTSRLIFHQYFSSTYMMMRNTVRIITVGLLFTAGNITPQSVNAQQDTLRGRNPTRADSIAAIAAWAKSDTGRMMPGYRDLSAYDVPGMCLMAMRGVLEATWRRVEADTLARYTPGDTVPTAVREIGQTCLAKMTPESVDSADLYDLMRAALTAGDTALARKTVVYHASKMTRSVNERAGVFVDAIGFALQQEGGIQQQNPEIHPTHPEWVESIFPLLMAIGPDAKQAIYSGFGYRRRDAFGRFDTAAIVRLTTELSAFIQGLRIQDRQDSVEMRRIFSDSMEIVRYQRDPNLAQTVRRLGDRYIEWTPENDVERLIAQGDVEGELRYGKFYGTPAPTSFSPFRKYPSDAPVGPVPGRVTLVGFIERLGSGFMDPYLAALRRLHEKYHAQGFDIMLIARTQGFAWESPPLDSLQEAKLIGWYYREYLKLPFTILIFSQPFSRRSDGRLVPQGIDGQIPLIGPFSEWRPWWGYIISRDGTIVRQIFRTEWTHRREKEIEAYIRRELAIPASTRASTSGRGDSDQ